MRALYDVAAPAKLNLFLHVLGRRSDGYHLLQSAFMLIDWHDVLHFELRTDGGLSRQDLGHDTLPEQDLCLRAAQALKASTACPQGVHITLDKRIPQQAGMGGGSSDAASCLLALNRLWRLNLSAAQLARIGLGLGADVPFFLLGCHAWVQGIGEQLQALQLPPARFAVVKPKIGLDTGLIFADPLLCRQTQAAIIPGFAADPYGFGHNDLQPVAQRLCTDVTQALHWLEQRGGRPRMTGSGSAVFTHMPQTLDLTGAPKGWQVRVCSNLEAHPLRGWAASDSSSVGGAAVS